MFAWTDSWIWDKLDGMNKQGGSPDLEYWRQQQSNGFSYLVEPASAGMGVVMEIKKIDYDFSVCKVTDYSLVDLNTEFNFIGKTDEENSLVCRTSDVPPNVTERDDGWKTFRIQGVLDFSLIGILSKISGILAENEIGIFAISTFNTDYVLTKKENYQRALEVLNNAGYKIVE